MIGGSPLANDFGGERGYCWVRRQVRHACRRVGWIHRDKPGGYRRGGIRIDVLDRA